METHQEIGKKLELFFINDTSPGSIFWKPRGALLFNNLIRIIRDLYDRYGYVEVVSPNIYDKKLWETSGHWDKYRENMFILKDIHHRDYDGHHISDKNPHGDIQNESMDDDSHKQLFSIKPMSCPGHCLIFDHMRPLSKDLPIRMAEFAVLHRNESTGSLHGLTRVRRFQQDDAHIFCRLDQVRKEVTDTLAMIDSVYSRFDLKYTIKLSTRPEHYIGTVEIWDQAEAILEDVIKEFTGKKVKKNVGDGAFYGPKIDVTLVDKYGRSVQCGTIQLDFNLPIRFDLGYTDEHDQSHHRPVIVHRAVLGSVERFIGIVLEHSQGRFPIQVSPYPVTVITVHKEFNDSAVRLRDHIHNSLRKRNVKMDIDIDISDEDIKNKVKKAERKGYCYIVTVGKDETSSMKEGVEMTENSIDDATVAVRVHKTIKPYQVSDLVAELVDGYTIPH